VSLLVSLGVLSEPEAVSTRPDPDADDEEGEEGEEL